MGTQDIEYTKPNQEVYKIRRREPIPAVRQVPIWLIIPLLILMVVGGYLVFNGVSLEETGQTEYSVSGDIDYQVYLKDNEYYTEKYLGAGRQYIANLINTIRADFDYSLEADAQVNANYEYEIVATVVATDRNDKTQVLYEQTDKLKSSEILPIENGTITIDDNVTIDYNKYNEYMRNFRSDFGIAANCFLDLQLIVKVDGAIKTEDVLAMNIPLSDQTLNIDISTEEINREEKVGEARTELVIKNLPVLIVGGVMVLAGAICSIILSFRYKNRFGDNWYAEAEYKINKNYDTHIVNATTSYRESGELVRVGEFIELVDASRNEGTPIVRYDVDPEYKSYYVVDSGNGLKTYRYTLSRAYQDNLRKTGQPKERF